MQDVGKWEAYHQSPQQPPWESEVVFSELPALMQQLECPRPGMKFRAIEFGCGASASALWLANAGWETTAVDISPRAIERALALDPERLVRWVQADVLNLPAAAALAGEEDDEYDLVFDMQCFHFMRDVDKEGAVGAISRCLKPGTGVAVVVVGAPNPDATTAVGPCRLTREEFEADFSKSDLELVSLTLSAFNPTPYYDAHFPRPPPCWIGCFRKRGP